MNKGSNLQRRAMENLRSHVTGLGAELLWHRSASEVKRAQEHRQVTKSRLRAAVLGTTSALLMGLAGRANADVNLRGEFATYPYSTNQSVGVMTPNFGDSNIVITGTTTVTASSLAPRNNFAAVNLTGAAIGTTQKLLITSQAAGLMPVWFNVNGKDFALYDTTKGVIPMVVGAGATDYTTTLDAGRFVKVSASTTLATDLSIRGLSMDAGSDVFPTFSISSGKTLTLADGALITSTDGMQFAGGTIAAGDGGLFIRSTDPRATAGGTTILSELNVGSGGITKAGDGVLTLSGVVKTTGDIRVVGGGLQITSDNTGRGAGLQIRAEGQNGSTQLMATAPKNLGDYSVNLVGASVILGAGNYANSFTGLGSISGTTSTVLSGQIVTIAKPTNTYITAPGISFGTLTIGGGATDVTPNIFHKGGLMTESGTTVLNKAPGVDALGGDIYLPSGTLRLAADNQISDLSDIGMIGGILDLNGHTESVRYIIGFNANIKLGTGGRLSFTGTSNGSAASGLTGTLSGAGSLVFRGSDQITSGLTMTYTGGLIVEDGTLNMSTADGHGGGVFLRGGTANITNDGAIGVASGAINFDGGRMTGAFTTARTINLTSTGIVDATVTASGAIKGTGALRKQGTGTFTLTGTSDTTGTITAEGGTIFLRGAAGAFTSGVTLETKPGATWEVTDIAGVPSSGARLAPASTVKLSGGIFALNAAGRTESPGTLAVAAGDSSLAITAGTLSFATQSPRVQGATLNTAITAGGVLVGGTAAGFIGGWAVSNRADFSKYDPATGIVPFAAGDYAATLDDGVHTRLTAGIAAPLTAVAPTTLTLDTSAGAVSVIMPPTSALTIASGGLLKIGAAVAEISGESITSSAAPTTAGGASELFAHVEGGDLTISAPLTGNIALVKGGSGKLRLTALTGNTNTGRTYVNRGTLELASAAPNAAINSDITINGGTLRLAGSEQIADTATITLNAGTFDLNGFNETIYNFANNGGAFIAGGGRLTVLSPNTATFSSGSTTIANAQIMDATGVLITGGTNVISAGGTLNTFNVVNGVEGSGGLRFEGTRSPALQVAGTLALGGDVKVAVTGLSPSAAITGAGTINLRGARNFDIQSGSLTVSPILTNGSIVKLGAGTLRLAGSGVSTFAGGIQTDAGTTEILNMNALGSGPIGIGSGKLHLHSDAVSLTLPNNLNLTGSATLHLDRATYGNGGTTPLAVALKFSAPTVISGTSLTVSSIGGGSVEFAGATTLAAPLTLKSELPLTFSGAVGESAAGGGFTKPSGGGVLTFSGATSNTYTGSTIINAGSLVLAKTGGALAVPGHLTVSGGAKVTYAGANQIGNASIVTLSGAGTVMDTAGFSDAIGGLTVGAGTALRTGTGALGIAGAINIAGSAEFSPASPAVRADSLTVSGSLKLMRPTGSAVRPLVTQTLNLAPNATIDLGDQGLVVDYTAGDTSPAAGIRAAIVSAFASNTWKGVGITSSTVTTNVSSLAIGYAEATGANFMGEVVDSSTVLVRATLRGDADLDGTVNLNDLIRLANHYGGAGDWSGGDFDYDGIVNLNDLIHLANQYGSSLAGSPIAAAPADFAADLATAFQGAAAVPEPTSLALIGMAGLVLKRRRRRS